MESFIHHFMSKISTTNSSNTNGTRKGSLSNGNSNGLTDNLRRNMARALLKTREFKTSEVGNALGLPIMVCASFLAAQTRRGSNV